MAFWKWIENNQFDLYWIGLLITGGLFIASGIFSFLMKGISHEKLDPWSRNRQYGIPIMVINFLWIIPYVAIFFNQYEDYSRFYFPLMILCGLVCYYLDFLMVRAVAGILILWVYFATQSAFVYYAPFESVFCLFLYVLGIGAIILAGKPYWGRDLIRKLADGPFWIRCSLGIFLILLGGGSLILGILFHALKG